MKVNKELKAYLKRYRKNLKLMELYNSKVLEFNKKFENIKQEDMTASELDEARELWDMYDKLYSIYYDMKKRRRKLSKGTKLKKKSLS